MDSTTGDEMFQWKSGRLPQDFATVKPAPLRKNIAAWFVTKPEQANEINRYSRAKHGGKPLRIHENLRWVAGTAHLKVSDWGFSKS
jgi:hypothetical protein